MEVERGVVARAGGRDRGDAGLELACQPLDAARRATAARRASARRGASRAESKIASGPAIVAARAAATKPSPPRTCGPRRIQNSANQARWPSSQAIGLMPGCCGTRQSASLRSSVRASVVARASRSASARAGAGEPARGVAHDRDLRAMPSSFDVACPAARLHRLAGARCRQQRQLAHGGALARFPGAGGDGDVTDSLAARRRQRPAHRPARAPLGGRDRRRARAPSGAADRRRPDRHRPLSRPRR